MNLHKNRKKFSGAWNFGPQQKNKSVKNLVDTFYNSLKKRLRLKLARAKKINLRKHIL